MKGFKKDGKFRPTEKKSKSSLKKSDVNKKVETGWIEPYYKEGWLGKKPTERKDMSLDEDELDELPVALNFKVLNDKEGIDHTERRLEPIRLPAKNLEDLDIGKAVHKALKILKERGTIPEDADAKFDDLGFEGWMLDVYIRDDEHPARDLAEHQGIRLSMEAWVDPDGDFDEEYGDDFDQGEAEHLVNEKLQEQFDDEYSGSSVD